MIRHHSRGGRNLAESGLGGEAGIGERLLGLGWFWRRLLRELRRQVLLLLQLLLLQLLLLPLLVDVGALHGRGGERRRAQRRQRLHRAWRSKRRR